MPGSGERRTGDGSESTWSRAPSNGHAALFPARLPSFHDRDAIFLSGLAHVARHTLAALVALCCCAPGAALAQPSGGDGTEPFRLVWSSSAGCGDARGFSSELKSRTALLRDAVRGEHAITFIVETFREREGVRGQLTVRKPGGELSVREVPGASCEEVESAMALIAALMVDPLATGSPRPPRRPEAAPEPKPAPAYGWRVEHRLIGQSAVAPQVAWGQAGQLMVTREASAWRPSLALSAHVARATTSAPSGSAELEWAVAQLSVCPLGVQPSARWDLRACAALQLGRLRGTGFETASPASTSVFWSAAGLQLEARWELLEPLWVGWEGALTFPFTRERFFLEPEETLHRIPFLAGSFGLGVGLRIF